MKSFCRFLCVLVALLLFGSPASAQVDVSTRLVNQSLVIFFLKDFDITRPASGPPIFFIDLINRDSQVHNIVLLLRVESRRHGPLSSGETVEFPVQPGVPLTLTNRDLFSNTGPYRLQNYQVNDEATDALLKSILATGKLPSDIYSFDIQVLDRDQNQLVDEEQFDIRISNPQKLDLIFPGRPAAGRVDDCPEVFTHLPQFRWESEMRRFRIVIAELRPGEDPESALNQEPRFVRVFALGSAAGDLGDITEAVEVIPSSSFQYPASGELLTLRPGNTYVWRAQGIVESSSGPITLDSEIYCFKIGSITDSDGRQQQWQFILRNILGPDYSKLFGEGGELEGYSAQRVTFNGEVITFGELIRRMQRLSSNYNGYRIE